MNYILHYDYAAIGVMIFTLYFLVTRKDMSRRDNKVLLVLTLMNLFSAVADIIAITVQSDVARFGLGPGKFWNTAYLLVHTQMGMVLVIYTIELLGIRDRLKRWHWIVMMIPSFVVLGVLLLNPFLEWYFYYNEQNIYSYGPMTPVVFAGPFIQLFVMLVMVIRFRQAMPKNMLFSICVFFVLTMIAVAVQHSHRELLVELFVQSLGILGVLLAVENKDEIRSLVTTLDELDAERQRAENASRYKSDFLANMSHEIRTPINAVLGMNEMLLREVVHAKQMQPQTDEDVSKTYNRLEIYAHDIRSAGQNLLSIVNDILDFSKIESGKMELTEGEYKLSSVLNDVSNMIAFRARTKNLDFNVDVDKTLPDGYFGDEVRVRQILTNVLTNAVKYTEKGSVTLTVRGEAEGDAVKLVYSVSDTGIGIRESDIRKLFSKFERVDLNKTNTIEGTGLGLAITKSLLDMMHGTITVASEYGKGSVFTITIPQRVTGDSPIGDFRERFEAAIHAEAAYHETFRAPDARILVVDDTAINLTVFKGLITDTQVKVNTAGSGKQALEMTKDIPFDVIFMDQRMPEMDGSQTLQHIRAQEDGVNRETPVISLTADAVQGARERYLREGFIDYLSKPVEGLQLEEMLIRYLPKEKVEIMAEPVKDRNTSADNASAADRGFFAREGPVSAGDGEGFAEEETISPEEAMRIIGDETPGLLESYRALAGVIDRILGLPERTDEPDTDKTEMEASDLEELYGAVLEFAACYDIDSVDMLLKQAKDYRMPEAEKERFDALVRCARASDWDGIKNLLEG